MNKLILILIPLLLSCGSPKSISLYTGDGKKMATFYDYHDPGYASLNQECEMHKFIACNCTGGIPGGAPLECDRNRTLYSRCDWYCR